jgi:hypothetical protein
MYRNDQWWIESVVNEPEVVAAPIPETVFTDGE